MGPAVFTSHEDICSVPLYFSEIFAKKGNVTGFRRVLIVKMRTCNLPVKRYKKRPPALATVEVIFQ